MSLSAKDWQPLGDAFEVHIRSPLKDDPSVNGEWRRSGEYPLHSMEGADKSLPLSTDYPP